MTIKALCKGICSHATLSRLEIREDQKPLDLLEPLFQRLGRDVSQYCNFFLSAKDFRLRQLREEIYMLLFNIQFDKANRLLNELERDEEYKKKNVNLQFIKMSRAIIFDDRNSHGQDPTYLAMLMDALLHTCKDFDENKIESYALTYCEALLINQIASYHGNTGNISRAVNMYGQLCSNIDRRYTDDTLKARIYATIMYNYSKYLGLSGDRLKALAIIEQVENYERDRERLVRLHNFNGNKAYGLYMLGRQEESVPYFALAYYGAVMVADYGGTKFSITTRNFVREHFGILFN